MCGIAGVATRGQGFDLSPVAAALRHRGPDGEATTTAAGAGWAWGLAHTRLAIVDLSPAGSQPMTNEDGSLVMIFNGEIYNHRELRQRCESAGHRFSSSMDGEVIIHLWEMEGVAALARLNGIFSIAVADTRTGEIVIARDPIGVKPLFYSSDTRGRLWFASELSALAAAGAPMDRDDVVGMAQFLSFLWIPDPRTPFTGVSSLEPGYALRWTTDGMSRFSFAEELVPEPAPAGDLDGAVADLGEQFRQAAERQLLGDVPIGLMASGGVDSGLIWWATHQSLSRAFTIEWGEPSGSEGLEDDAKAVRELEQRFGTSVCRLSGELAEDALLPRSGDLFADPALDLTRLIARTARDEGYKVLLSGQGGDELFGGYRRHAAAPFVERLRLGAMARRAASLVPGTLSSNVRFEYMSRLLRAVGDPDPFRGYMQLCTYSSARDRARVLDCDESEVGDDVVWERHRDVFEQLPTSASFFRRVTVLDLRVYLPGLGLAYVDRGGMEFGVEIRVPWLDLELVRAALRLPDDALRRDRRGKWITRELASRELSSAIAHRPKRGFAAPANRVNRAGRTDGERGFRQAAYFTRAQSLVRRHLASPRVREFQSASPDSQ